LCKLVREVNAIRELAVIDKSDQFSEQAAQSARDMGEVAKRLVKDPGKTLGNAARGAKKIFRDLGESISDDEQGSEVEDSGFKEIVGFSRMKRQYAYELGVDVYTNNETLDDYLNRLAWAAFSGRVSVKIGASIATSGLAGAATSLTSSTTTVEEIIRDTSPGDLREQTRSQLLEQGINEDLVSLFIRNEELSPRHQGMITGALAAIDLSEGKDHIIRRAAKARSYEEAFDRQVQAQMYLLIDSEIPLRRFVDIGNDRVVAEADDGSLHIAATVDYLVWTNNLEGLMEQKNQRLEGLSLKGERQLWLSGGSSARARDGLAKLGWSVRSKVLWEHAGTVCSPVVSKVSVSANQP
jgi:hypothetical protein